MRTTLRLNASLMSELKRMAAETHKTLTSIIEDAVREVLARRAQAPKRKPVRLPTFKGHGLQPGVDLDNTAALMDLMEDR